MRTPVNCNFSDSHRAGINTYAKRERLKPFGLEQRCENSVVDKMHCYSSFYSRLYGVGYRFRSLTKVGHQSIAGVLLEGSSEVANDSEHFAHEDVQRLQDAF